MRAYDGAAMAIDATRLALEEERMARVPGIYFRDENGERRAKIDGTGLDVRELIAVYLAVERDRARWNAWFDWLSDAQLDAALAYYAAYPDEIDDYVERSARIEAYVMEHGPLVPPYPPELLALLR